MKSIKIMLLGLAFIAFGILGVCCRLIDAEIIPFIGVGLGVIGLIICLFGFGKSMYDDNKTPKQQNVNEDINENKN